MHRDANAGRIVHDEARRAMRGCTPRNVRLTFSHLRQPIALNFDAVGDGDRRDPALQRRRPLSLDRRPLGRESRLSLRPRELNPSMLRAGDGTWRSATMATCSPSETPFAFERGPGISPDHHAGLGRHWARSISTSATWHGHLGAAQCRQVRQSGLPRLVRHVGRVQCQRPHARRGRARREQQRHRHRRSTRERRRPERGRRLPILT